jgi:hypothetical protein
MFSIDLNVYLQYGPGVIPATNKYEFQESSWDKACTALTSENLTAICELVVQRMREPRYLIGLHDLLQRQIYLLYSSHSKGHFALVLDEMDAGKSVPSVTLRYRQQVAPQFFQVLATLYGDMVWEKIMFLFSTDKPNGYCILYTVYTSCLNTFTLFILLTERISVFHTVLTVNSDCFSKHGINRMGSVVETCCVSCKVQTEFCPQIVSVCSVWFSQ